MAAVEDVLVVVVKSLSNLLEPEDIVDTRADQDVSIECCTPDLDLNADLMYQTNILPSVLYNFHLMSLPEALLSHMALDYRVTKNYKIKKYK